MSDIVKRLNKGEGCLEEGGKTCISMDAESGCICAIAADEITALRAEVERLKAVEADYDLHEREMIDLEEDNGRLRAENEKLRAALKSCIAMLEQLGYTPISKVARAALEGT